MHSRTRRILAVAAGMLLTAAALACFLFRLRGHWDDVGRAFARANYLSLIPSVGFIAVMYALRVLRWRVFLTPIQRVPYSAIASATLIGFMSNCVLWLRPGELIRPYVLHRKGGIGFGHAAGTALGLERVFDLIGVCFLLLLTLIVLSAGRGTAADRTAAADAIMGRAVWFAALTAVGFGCLLALAFFPGSMLGVARACLRVAPKPVSRKLMAFANSVAEATQFIRQPGRVLVATALSLAIWFCFPLSTYSLARGFGLEIGFVGALVVQVFVTAAVAVPQAPAFIGIFQVAAMAGVRIFGVPQGQAGAFATALWGVNVLPITAAGLAALWFAGFSVRGLVRASKEATADARLARE